MNKDAVENSNPTSAKDNREQFAIKKSYSVENGYGGSTRSLVGDAKFETLVRKETKLSLLENLRKQSKDSIVDEIEGEDIYLWESLMSTNEKKTDDKEKIKISLILIGIVEPVPESVSNLIKLIEEMKGELTHLETRSSTTFLTQFDAFVKIHILKSNFFEIINSLKKSNLIRKINILSGSRASPKLPWFPTHISELDQCNHLVTKYEPELDMDHPGWSDQAYRKRRKEIADISFNYKHGDPIPNVKYTDEEIATWAAVYEKVTELFQGKACSIHIAAFERMKHEVGCTENNIPQLEDVSRFLNKSSGFTLRPAAGLVTARDFLASLAFRVFQCTQYIRHGSQPHYSPEPDCIHELLGHCPMFADKQFAQFSQEIGLASLGATDEEIEKIATLYWFTVEFGLCKENGNIRAYGAGLLSSYGELLHSLSDEPEVRDFDPECASLTEYDDQAYQMIYYVAESFEDAQEKVRRWVNKNITRPFEMRYCPYTQTVEALDSVHGMKDLVSEMKVSLNHFNNAVKRIERS